MIDRLPPHNLEAEEGLISSCLQGYQPNEIFDILTPTDFYRSSHQAIFNVIKTLYLKKLPIDLVTVVAGCKDNGKLEIVGGASGIVKIMDDIPVAVNPAHYAKLIKTASIARSLLAAAYKIADEAYSATADNLSDVFDSAQSQILTITSGSIGKAFKKINIENVYTAERMIDSYELYIRTLKDNRFLTGINQIDMRIRGVSGGEVMTVIARAGSFKTAMLQNMLLNYTNNSLWSAVFFSLEMPISSVTERYMGITMKFEGREVEDLYLENIQTGNQAEYLTEIKKDFIKRMQRIFVVPVKVSLNDAAEYVRLIEYEYKTKVGVIGIDYLGLIDAPGKNEYEIVSGIARGAKDLAKAINLPVVLLCQTSRAGTDGETEITMDSARGSGAIEEGADFVLGLWQQEIKDSMAKPTGKYDLICRILKNRKGSKGSRWKLDLEPSTLSFSGESVEFTPVEIKKNSKKRP